MNRQTHSELTLYTANTIIHFRYTNHKLETESRRARIMSVWYGTSEYHQGEQWFLMARDLDRDAIRNFAMRDMTGVTTVAAKLSDD